MEHSHGDNAENRKERRSDSESAGLPPEQVPGPGPADQVQCDLVLEPISSVKPARQPRGSRSGSPTGMTEEPTRGFSSSESVRDGLRSLPEQGGRALHARRERASPQAGKSTPNRPGRRWWCALTRSFSGLKETHLLLKKAVRSVIFYTVTVLCLFPLLVFRHKVLIVLYLFLWTNIALAVAAFLDELFDLPRKR